MFKKTSLLAIMCALCLSFSLATGQDGAAPPSSDAADKALQERIARLIEQLGSDKFDDREAAEKELIEIGDDAREAVQAASKSPDIETAERAKKILYALDRPRVTLVCEDMFGNPLKERNVAIVSSGVNQQVTTDQNGAACLPPIEGQEMTLYAWIDGYEQVSFTRTRIQVGKYVFHVRFTPLGTVRGAVLDSSNNNAPLANATVKIGGISAVTDANGRFELKNVKPGYWCADIRYQNSDGYRMLDVAPGEATEVVFDFPTNFNRPPLVTLKVAKILKPDGSPLSDTEIKVVRSSLKETTAEILRRNLTSAESCKTDKDGGVSFECYSDEDARPILFVEGYKPAELGVVKIAPDKTFTIEKPVKLDAGAAIEVTIHDSAGKPIKDAAVMVQPRKFGRRVVLFAPPGSPEAESEKHWAVSSTDEKGVVKMNGLYPGAVEIHSFHPDYSRPDHSTVVLEDGKSAKIDITLYKPATYNIVAVDAETGAPLNQAGIQEWTANASDKDVIIVQQPMVIWDRDERIVRRAKTVSPGKHFFVAQCAGYRPGYFLGEFKEGEATQGKILLKKLGKGDVAGRIVPCESAPLGAVQYAILYPLEGRRTISDERNLLLAIDKNGRFKAVDLFEGVWAIDVRGNDGNIIARKIFVVKNGETANADVRLRPCGSLRATLLGEDGKPQKGARLMLLERDYETMRASMSAPCVIYPVKAYTIPSLPTDKDGVCVFSDVPEGEYYLAAEDSKNGISYIGQRWEVKIAAGAENKVELRRSQKTTIEGKIVGEIATPTAAVLLADVAELCDVRYAIVAYAFAAEDGTFKIEDVLPGKYRLAAFEQESQYLYYLHSGTDSEVTNLDVREGVAIKSVELRLNEKYQKFSGRVANHVPSVDRVGDVLLVGKCIRIAAVRPDGTFSVAAPPGKYKACYINRQQPDSESNFKRKPIDVTIEDGKDLSDIEIP